MSFVKTILDLLDRLVLSVMVPTGVIVLCLYIFRTFGDMQYLPASALAFGIGFYVIYLVFKYWVKPDPKKVSSKNLWHFLIVFGVNLVINIEIVYLLVSHVGVPLLTAQAVAAVVIAYESYYAYQSLLYRAKQLVVQMPKRLEDEIVYYDESGQKM